MNEEEFIKKTRENFTGKSILGRPVNPDALAYTLLGENEYKKDNYEGAIEWYSKSINIDSANHYNFTQRGKSYMFLKVYDKALTDLFLSQKLDDNFPNNQAIAECYLFKQEHNVAIKYFNIALDKMTDS